MLFPFSFFLPKNKLYFFALKFVHFLRALKKKLVDFMKKNSFQDMPLGLFHFLEFRMPKKVVAIVVIVKNCIVS
jgi:hypothetical protein